MTSRIRVFGWQTSTAAEFDFRIGLPFPLLDPGRFEWAWGQPGPDIHDYDVVFAHRLAGRSELWHDLCADSSVLAIYDMDDDLLCVDPANTVPYRVFAPLVEETRRNVLAADAVTVSSPGLLERYAAMRDNVTMLPICIPADMPYWPDMQWPATLTVGWAGSTHKRQDWPDVAEELARYARLVPQARFRMYGGDYTRGLLAGSMDFVPFTSDVMAFWRSLNFDIGIAPLVDTPFNRGKCHTKLIEYGARGIPTVASAIGQNVEWIEHGVNGLLVNHPSDWVPNLLALTDDGVRRSMSQAAWDCACEWTIDRHVDKWQRVFSGKVSS